jgi:repressor LexA
MMLITMDTIKQRKISPPWARRLRARREELGYTQEDVVSAGGDVFSQRTVSHLEKGTSPLEGLGLAKAAAYAKALRWDLQDLQNETGINLGLTSQPPPLLLEPTVKHKPDIVILPIRALADAGTPHQSINTDLGDYIMPRENYRNGLEIFVADGQSMRRTEIEGIHDQDTLIVDVQDFQLRDNKVYVVCDEAGGYTVKRVRNWNGQWWLTSDNSKFPPFQMDEAKIVGRVVKVESERDF